MLNRECVPVVIDIPIANILPTDEVFTRGTQAYADAGGRFAGKKTAAA